MKKTFARLAAIVVVAVGLPLLAAQPASAATCVSYGCDYLDPQTTGCAADAYTLFEVTSPTPGAVSVKVELRYSPSCQAAWARGTQPNVDDYLEVGGNLEFSNSTTGVTSVYSMDGYHSRYSSMQAAPYTLRACYRGYNYTCTSWW